MIVGPCRAATAVYGERAHLEAWIPAHIACRPITNTDDPRAGCFVVCAEHELRRGFGTAHAVAHAACVEHNRLHHLNRVVRSPKILSVVYESFSTVELTEADFLALLGQARASNRDFGVTGMLLTQNGWFLQALEGPEPIVNSLMLSIKKDKRHTHVRELAREVVRDRRFPDWSMAHGHIGDIESLPLAQYYEALLMTRAKPDSIRPS